MTPGQHQCRGWAGASSAGWLLRVQGTSGQPSPLCQGTTSSACPRVTLTASTGSLRFSWHLAGTALYPSGADPSAAARGPARAPSPAQPPVGFPSSSRCEAEEMTSTLLPRQTRRLPNTQGLASPCLSHRSPSPLRSSPQQPSRGVEQWRSSRSSRGALATYPHHVPALPYRGWSTHLHPPPGCQVPTHHCHRVLGNARGSVPKSLVCRGCPGWRQLTRGAALLKGVLQLLAWPQAESWPEPPPASYNNKPRSGEHLSPGWSSKGPDIPNICGRERGRQRAIGEVPEGPCRVCPLPSVLGWRQQSVASPGQLFRRARFSLEGQILLLPHIPAPVPEPGAAQSCV